MLKPILQILCYLFFLMFCNRYIFINEVIAVKVVEITLFDIKITLLSSHLPIISNNKLIP